MLDWLGWMAAGVAGTLAAGWKRDLERARRQIRKMKRSGIHPRSDATRSVAQGSGSSQGTGRVIAPPPLPPAPLPTEFPRHMLLRRLTGVLPRFRLPDDDGS